MKMKRVISIGMIMLCACMPIQSSAAQIRGTVRTNGGTDSKSVTAYYNSNAPMECAMSVDLRVSEGVNNTKSTVKYDFYLLGTNCKGIGSANHFYGYKWYTTKKGIQSGYTCAVDSTFKTATMDTMNSRHYTKSIYDGAGKPYASAELWW